MLRFILAAQQSGDFDIGSLFDNLRSFFRTFFDTVMDSNLRGLIVYFWGCFPPFLRAYILSGVVCVILVAFFQTFRQD